MSSANWGKVDTGSPTNEHVIERVMIAIMLFGK